MFKTTTVHNDNVRLIKSVCELLEEELTQQPKTSRKIVATMYYLASIKIKESFGLQVTGFKDGHDEVYALSGFKKPLQQLVDQAYTAKGNDKQSLESQLIEISNYFDDRFGQITQRSLAPCEYLNEWHHLGNLN